MKKLFFFIQGLFAYPFLALPAFAQTSVDPCTDATTYIAKTLCKAGSENTAKTIQNIIVVFIVLAVVVALLYLLYGGLKWITSRGEKTEVEAARNHIIAAVVGLIVVFLAIFIISIILAVFGIPFDKLVIPKIIP